MKETVWAELGSQSVAGLDWAWWLSHPHSSPLLPFPKLSLSVPHKTKLSFGPMPFPPASQFPHSSLLNERVLAFIKETSRALQWSHLRAEPLLPSRDYSGSACRWEKVRGLKSSPSFLASLFPTGKTEISREGLPLQFKK